METRVFRYRIHFGNEINRERWVDQEVNLPEERRPRRSIETRVFRYRMHFGNEIKSKKWLTRRSTFRCEWLTRRSTIRLKTVKVKLTIWLQIKILLKEE